jgi:hypothetical protein
MMGARFDILPRLQFLHLGFEFLVHRQMHVAIQLDEIGKHQKGSLHPFG